MSGVKHEWMGGQFVQLHRELLRALDGDYETAAVIWAVHYHTRPTHPWWAATRQEFMDSTCLSKAKLDRALRRARDEGYLETSSGAGLDRTLSWRVVYSDASPENRDMHEQDNGSASPENREEQSRKQGHVPSVLEHEEEGGRVAPQPSAKPSRRRKPEVPLPEDFEPNGRCAALAAELGVDMDRELRAFRDHAEANDRRMRDWQATFRTWLNNAAEFSRRGGGGRHLAVVRAGSGPRPLEELEGDDRALMVQQLQVMPLPYPADYDDWPAERQAEWKQRAEAARYELAWERVFG